MARKASCVQTGAAFHPMDEMGLPGEGSGKLLIESTVCLLIVTMMRTDKGNTVRVEQGYEARRQRTDAVAAAEPGERVKSRIETKGALLSTKLGLHRATDTVY